MEEYFGIVYKVTNKINGKIYIGQTVKFLSIRISEHIHDALKNRDNTYFHNAIKRYGLNNFKWEIIVKCNSLKELNETEIEMIKKYNTFEDGYNLTNGGGGLPGRHGKLAPMYGKKHSEETKKRISNLLKGENHPMYGKHLSKETKEKISNANKGKAHLKGKEHPMYGKQLMEDVKRKISNANKGKSRSDKIKNEISKITKGKNNPMYGKYHSEETKKKMSEMKKGKNHPFYGKKHSEETKRKISLSQVGLKNHMYGKIGVDNPSYGKKLSRITKDKIGESNSCLWLVIFPDGTREVIKNLRKFCRINNVLYDNGLRYVANGKYKQYKGFKCKKVCGEIIICQR